MPPQSNARRSRKPQSTNATQSINPKSHPNAPQRINSYDAIVIGSGISGGWAAKELCDHGLKTLILERGKDVSHIKDYPTATKNPWDFVHRNDPALALKKENPIVSKCYAFDESAQ